METTFQKLTASQFKYLRAIDAASAQGPARLVDIARRMGHAKPSAHKMLAHLTEAGLVCRDARSRCQLTPAGRETLAFYESRVDALCARMRAVLGLTEEAAREDALNIATHLSREALRHVARLFCADEVADTRKEHVL